MDGTILSQGTFTASFSGTNPNPGNATDQCGDAKYIIIPSNVDWLKVYNYNWYGQLGSQTIYLNGTNNAFASVEFYWQRGMAPGTAIVKMKEAGSNALNGDTMLNGGFTLFDPSGQSLNQGALPLLSAPVATTASTNATQPVVSTGNTAGLSVGSVVRMSNTAQTDINGIDMVVGAVVANTSFTLLTASNPLANAPGAIGGAGFYRIVNADYLFYPRKRYVVNVTQAVNAQVSTSVAHGLTPGQLVRFNIPQVSGMVQLNATPLNNYQPATILSVIDDYNFTINIDTTAFTAFTWPTIAQQPSSFPEVTPFGEDTAAASSIVAPQVPSIGGQQIYNTNTGILADSTVNTGFLGMLLGSGGASSDIFGFNDSGPAGTVHFSAGDVITSRDTMYWVAGKSSFGGL